MYEILVGIVFFLMILGLVIYIFRKAPGKETETEMKEFNTCPECGASITGVGEFCPRCGSDIEYIFVTLDEEHRKPVISIINYYIRNSYVTFREKRVSYKFFDQLLDKISGYPAIVVKQNKNSRIIGFGFLSPYHPLETLRKTAEIVYYLLPEYTGKGIGKEILNYLTQMAREKGIENLLVSISSLNTASIRFHQKNGFIQCGQFKNIAERNNQKFDVIWMQKQI
jgi:L-amino acid N-acyltransferase YncA